MCRLKNLLFKRMLKEYVRKEIYVKMSVKEAKRKHTNSYKPQQIKLGNMENCIKEVTDKDQNQNQHFRAQDLNLESDKLRERLNMINKYLIYMCKFTI